MYYMVKTEEGATKYLIYFGEEFKYSVIESIFPGFKDNT